MNQTPEAAAVPSAGFLGALFDFTFSEFITTRIVKFIYILAIFVAALGCLGWVLGAFSHSFIAGLGALIVAPLGFLLYICVARVWLEIVIVIFRIAESLRTIEMKR